MKYSFNSTNLMTGYIKEMFRDFNLPVYTVYRADKPLYEGKIYVKDNSIIQIINGEEVELVNYNFNDYIQNATTNFIINSSYYDIPTHNYLGDYLRFIRDYKGINLMPLYNCFNTEKPIGLNYTITISSDNSNSSVNFKVNTDDENYSYYIVPAKFNETYTVAIDSPTPVEMACIIYTGDEVLDISKKLTKLTYKKFPGMSFLNPAYFSTNIDAGQIVKVNDDANIKAPYYNFESNLRILLKIPAVVDSTITILEGKFRNNLILGNKCTEYKFTDGCNILPAPTVLSLLRLNDKESYPFADRLVEYLIGNAVIPTETIKYNIGRLQKNLYNRKAFKGIYDVWGKDLRRDFYNFELKETKKAFFNNYVKVSGNWEKIANYKIKFIDSKQDLLAYGDKDLEYFLETSVNSESSDV